MCKVYGYTRISTKKQSIERQIRNIKAEYPEAIILQEAYTGTKIEGRAQFEKLMRNVKPGDTIVFDSVSRMSRNAVEGFALYEKLYQFGVKLVFLKEPHINTETYEQALKGTAIPTTGTNVDCILDGVRKYLMLLAQEQIRLAFEQSEKEVNDLRQRTKEGLQTAYLNGKQKGQKPGNKLNVKKEAPAKTAIAKYSKDFDGTLSDAEVQKLAGVSRNTFYKYKGEIRAEREAQAEAEAEAITAAAGKMTKPAAPRQD